MHMTIAAMTWDRYSRRLRVTGGLGFLDLYAPVKEALKFMRAGLRELTVLCLPLPGETACACESGEPLAHQPTNASPLMIEGWIAFPIAITDGTATGTVFLEALPAQGSRSRVVANLSVERGGIQNWIHFRLPFGEDLEIESAYGVRATLVATDALTGEKRLFGTTRAASLRHHKSEAGIILELEDWG
jgi:hypothetical protein